MSRTAAGRIKSVGPFLLLLSAAMLAAALISLCMGRYALSISEVFEILSSTLLNREPNVPLAARNVVLFVRLPRVMAALLVGAGLALSGATYQSIFKNPLAVPELLGVFQGSCVGAAIAILLNFSSFSIQLYALIGGITAVVLANVIMRFFKSDSTALLVLAGVIVSGLMSSILGLLKYWMDPETQLPTIVFWQMGSLADMTIKKSSLLCLLCLYQRLYC